MEVDVNIVDIVAKILSTSFIYIFASSSFTGSLSGTASPLNTTMMSSWIAILQVWRFQWLSQHFMVKDENDTQMALNIYLNTHYHFSAVDIIYKSS